MIEKSKHHKAAQEGASSSLPKAFGPADVIYIGFCIAAFLIAAFLFWNDLNMTLTRLSEQPVGTITYKYRAAQRRFVDRVLWDRLRQESPVYSGDYIRTAELSQATVSLNTGGIITLEENTLIQIFPEEGSFRIDLTGGVLSADARSGKVSIKAGDTLVEAVSGSMVQTAATAEGMDVLVLEGSAEIRERGEQLTAAAGEVFSAGRNEVSRRSARVAVLSPRPGAKFLNNGENPFPVSFSWNRIGFENNESVMLDIAEDRSFTRIVTSIESLSGEAQARLANGVYYWRAYPSSEAGAEIRQGGVSGRFTVVHAPPPRLIAPQDDEVFRFTTTRPGIRFQWTAGEGAAAYLIEAADNPAMTNPFYRSQIQAVGSETGSVVHSGLESGSYYWRVTPVYGRDYEGNPEASHTASFRIERSEALSAPEVRDTQRAVYLEGGQEESYFTWEQEDEAVSYTFLLSRNEDLSSPVVRETVRNNYYAFDVKAAGLNSGQYYWGVYQTDADGNDSAASAASVLVILAGAPTEAAPEHISVPAAETVSEASDKSEEKTLPELPEAPAPVPAPAPVRTPPVRPPAAAVPPPAAETAPGEAPAPVPVEIPPPPPEPPAPPPQTVEQPAEPRKIPQPANLRPASGYVLTQEIILRDRRMDFSWNPVSGAASYNFSIYEGNREIFRQTVQGTSYTLGDLKILDEGSFTWQVQAVPANRNTALPSDISESRFTVRLEETRAAEGQQSGVMFGKE